MSKPHHADAGETRRYPWRIAVHGMLADGVGSGAGSFPVLLKGLLERGHRVEMFGVRGFNEPKSLEPFENYRFVSLTLPWLQNLWKRVEKLESPYPRTVVSQISQVEWQREAVRSIEAEPGRFDLVLCTDAVALWPSTLPIVSWPQSPPHTEAAALRSRETMRRVIRSSGAGRFAAVQLFYAWRWLAVRAALRISDVYLCGSSWARDEWARFGAKPDALRSISYLVDSAPFRGVPALEAKERPPTFLWLGRATPRKRLDLFLDGFRLLEQRRPGVRARLVGNLRSDPYAASILAEHPADPAVRVEDAVERSSVPGLFAEVDVLVQPSENENFGFSVAEALAAGRPVVLGPTNGTADYAGEAGFVFSDYRPSAVADAMERALDAVIADGPGLSAKARQAAERHFAPSVVVDRFEAVCREVLARRGNA